MAKISLISAVQWLNCKLDQYDIPSREQLALFHVILHLNKNCWRPAQISINALALKMNVSKRTAKSALDALVANGWVIPTKNGLILNIDDIPLAKTDNPQSSNDMNSSEGDVNNGNVSNFVSLAERLGKINSSKGA